MPKKKNIPGIGMVGMSHKTADVELRECFSLDDGDINRFLGRLASQGLEEVVWVSTCNRIEVYFAAHDIPSAVNSILALFEEISSMPRNQFDTFVYRKYSRDCIHHLLAVASSLDSLVVGENEILGQIKDSYRRSSKEKTTGQVLNRLFHHAFKTAKRVRTETEIARSPLSVAYIATELARSIFEDLSRRKALLIGAGEMGELILKYLTKFNISAIIIANRSYRNAEKIAGEINREARIISLEEIGLTLEEIDIIISSVSSPAYVLTHDTVKAAVKKRGSRPLLMIDIAVPRNLDPGIGGIANVFLYNIDDLKTIADQNLKNRLKEVDVARRIIEEDADEFYEWYESLEVIPLIVGIQDKYNNIRREELDKYKRRRLKHIGEEDFKIIEEMTSQIMTKTLHNPIMFLKGYQFGEKGKKLHLKESIKLIEDIFLK